MKRLIIILLLALGTATASAQTEDEVMGSTGDLQFKSSVPVAGSRFWNRVTGLTVPDESFSQFFLEGTVGVGWDDLGVGMNFTYLPKRVGGYASWLHTLATPDVVSAGVAFRLFENTTYTDWHLYGGVALSQGLGVDAGVRVSATPYHNGGSFSWLSFSMGRTYVNGTAFLTFGLSLELIGWTGVWVFL